MKKYCENLLEAIGNTPLVKLNKITKGLGVEVFAKLEFLNPMGSVKDRIAKYMIEKAEREGKIKPGDLIIESSSGNTALGLALVAIQKGYKLKVVVRDNISIEKINQLKALGVEIHMVDHTIPPEDPFSYNNLASFLAKQTSNCYFPDQHNNRDNNEAHYNTTGPEIWEQMEGRIDYFVAGIGTGGTLCGVGKFLKEKDPKIKVIGVDPLGSVFYDYFHKKIKIKPKPYLIEGLGDEFLINCVDFSVIDDIYQVTDKEAFLFAREIAEKEGLLVGGSSGAAMWGVFELAKKINGSARIITIFPDSGSRYLSTIFNDDWMKSKGFI